MLNALEEIYIKKKNRNGESGMPEQGQGRQDLIINIWFMKISLREQHLSKAEWKGEYASDSLSSGRALQVERTGSKAPK